MKQIISFLIGCFKRVLDYKSKYKKIINDTFYYLAASLLPMILLVAINPLLAKNLSPDDYAIIGYIGSFSTFVTPLITFFLMRYYFKSYYKKSEEELIQIKSTVLQSLLLFSFILTCVIIGCISIYHFCFNKDTTLSLYPYLLFNIGSIWLGAMYTFQLAEYKLVRKSKKYFWLSLTKGIFSVSMFVLFVVIFKWGAYGYQLATLLSVITFFIYSLYKYRCFLWEKFDYTVFKDMIRFCWPLAIAGCLEFFTGGYNKVLLERIGNNAEYGIYIVGAQIAAYINVFTIALFSTFYSDIYECSAKKNWRKLYKIFGMLATFQVAVVGLFILLAPFIIDILTAGRYTMSVGYAQIIAVSQIFVLLFYIVNDVTIALGYSKLILTTKIIASVLSVIFISIIVYKWEYNGAAYGQIITYFTFFMINFLLLMRTINKKTL